MSEPILRGPVWVVHAEGREGTLVRVLVDAQTGRVANIVAIDRPYPPRIASGAPVSEGPWVPMGGPEYDDFPPSAGEIYPIPGGPRSSQGTKGGPEKKVASRPSTPLPKPRPADAQKDAPALATAPQAPENTGSVPASDKKEGTSATPAKTPEVAVSPL
jgi:hypothetical protein